MEVEYRPLSQSVIGSPVESSSQTTDLNTGSPAEWRSTIANGDPHTALGTQV